MLICSSKEDKKSAIAIKRVLDNLMIESWKSINDTKSRILFSLETRTLNHRLMNQELKLQETNDLDRYLGFSIHYKSVTKHDYSFIFEKVRTKLSNCEARLLSPTGRLTLIHATIFAVPISLFLVPSARNYIVLIEIVLRREMRIRKSYARLIGRLSSRIKVKGVE